MLRLGPKMVQFCFSSLARFCVCLEGNDGGCPQIKRRRNRNTKKGNLRAFLICVEVLLATFLMGEFLISRQSKVFQNYDTNKSGDITYQEFTDALSSSGYSAEQLKPIFEAVVRGQN